jgi:DNA-binding NarL/FixJ family response regulator
MSIAICDAVQVRAQNLLPLLRAGLRGVVLREHMTRTLLPAVAAVASGQVCLPSEEASRRPVLSMREKQVLRLVATGLMNAQIAERLFLAESTVKSHLSSAFAKLGVRSRHEAAEVLLNPASGRRVGTAELRSGVPEILDRE